MLVRQNEVGSRHQAGLGSKTQTKEEKLPVSNETTGLRQENETKAESVYEKCKRGHRKYKGVSCQGKSGRGANKGQRGQFAGTTHKLKEDTGVLLNSS